MKQITAMLRRMRRRSPLSHQNPARNLDCSEFEVDNWQLSQFILQKVVPVVGVHPFPLHELMLMAAAVCRFRPQQIFEWGTHIGKSARVFYECIAHFRISCQIHSVDLPEGVDHVEHPETTRGQLVRGLDGVHLYQGDGLTESLNLWRMFGQNERVLFFVDGDHEYKSVSRELAGILAEIPSAKILLHDTFFQSPESGYNVGPHRAIVDTIEKYYNRYRVIETATGLPGMTLIYSL